MKDKVLFDWQQRGFGHSEIRSFVVENKKEIIGFRGFIPGLYQMPRIDGGVEIAVGAASFMWSISPKYRTFDLALRMQKEAVEMCPILSGVSSNELTSRPFYQFLRFSSLPQTNRYVMPLCVDGYSQLLLGAVSSSDLKVWSKRINISINELQPHKPNVAELAHQWKELTFRNRIFSLYRSEEFFQWRYVDSMGFKYLFFGGKNNGGTIIARLENVIIDSKNFHQSPKVFRIIELIPYNEVAWKSEKDSEFVQTIQSTLLWAKERGAWAVDYHCSSTMFESLLKGVGFRNASRARGDALTNLAVLFQPLRWDKAIPDVFFHTSQNSSWLRPLTFDKVYMVKSDGDQDRPNYLE